ncbi:MAG: integrase arm-type DNA-binding domain-containing protein [Desulfovibrio sp.]|nr:integrase arm-type DNA-binding domain-containing protein [Desulfovibrio sp.]
MAGKLTDKLIRAVAPKEKAYKLFDGDGLYLEVAPRGGKWWRLKYRIDGKEKRISLGVYPEVSLAQARAKCLEARKLISDGIDPSRAKQESKAQAKAEEVHDTLTFETVANEWFSVKMAEKNEKYKANVRSYLENVLFPVIGSIPIADLKRSDIVPCLQAKASSGTTETAHRIAYVVGQVCEYAFEKELCISNVAAGISKILPEVHHRQRHAIVDPEQVGKLLRDIDAYPSGTITHIALRLMALTFVRSNELRGAKWQEIDFDNAMWTIPAERMKGRLEHLVPLSKQALALFKELQRCTGNGEYCFPSRGKDHYITEGALRQPLKRLGYSGVQDIHGFRGTASTLLNEKLRFRGDVIERQLAHVEKNEVRRAYNRALYLDERIEMMQKWADYLDELLNS